MAGITGSPEYMAKDYVAYQERYRSNPRESDKVLLSLIRDCVIECNEKVLLDIGCHNGNFLYHVHKEFPGFKCRGGDLFPEVVKQNASDTDLSGISFEVMDILDLKCDPVDVIVVNAVLFRFDDQQYRQAWAGIYDILRTGGFVFIFDWINQYRQILRIIEETHEHPEGLTLNVRPQVSVDTLLKSIGFKETHFYPFKIGIDLPLEDPQSAHFTHTKKLISGERLQFRGALYQPWCHMVAKK